VVALPQVSSLITFCQVAENSDLSAVPDQKHPDQDHRDRSRSKAQGQVIEAGLQVNSIPNKIIGTGRDTLARHFESDELSA
jgi:hypothetical protein